MISAQRLRLVLMMAGVSVISTVAAAQTSQEPDGTVSAGTQAAAGSTAGEAPSGTPTSDIIVTAQRRSQLLQKVPMSVNVATGDQLEKLTFTDFKDVQRLAPGLEMSNNDGRRNVAVIRGIQFEPDSGVQPAVDIYYNDIPIDAQDAFSAIYDVQQIEVLRGPQGLFRGRTSPAGAITLTTRRANLDEPEGYIQGTGTTVGALNVQGGASVPLVPGKVAIRLSGVYDFNDLGGIRNVTLDDVEASSKVMGGRASLALSPTERVRLNLMYQYFWTDLRPIRAVFGPGNAPGAIFGDPRRNGPPLTIEDRKGVANTLPRIANRTNLFTLNGEVDVTDNIMWSVDAARQDTLNLQTVDLTLGSPVIDYTRGVQHLDIPRKVWTVDTRISSTGSNRLDWMLGAFYSDLDAGTVVNQASDVFIPGPTGAAVFPIDVNVDITVRTKTKAVFGSLRYNITDKLRAEAGLRYSQYKNDQQAFLIVCLSGSCNVPAPSFPDNLAHRKESALTGGATLSYDWTPDLTSYVSYGHAYRPTAGQNGATFAGLGTPPELLVSKPEKSDAFEIGLKGSILDRRLSFSINGYYQKYKDFVDYFPGLNVRNTITGGISGIPTASNGDAIAKGVEMTLNGRVSRDFDLGLSAAYSDAHYDNAEIICNQFDPVTGAAFIPAGQFYATCQSNDRLAQVPKFSANTTGEYRLHAGDLTPFVRWLANYRPGFNSELDDFKYRDIVNVNVYLGVRGPDDRWEISAFVRNLLDQARATRVARGQLQASTVLGPDFPYLSGYRSVVITPPREFGVTARFSW